MERVPFKERFKEALEIKQKKPADIAKQLGVSRSTISQYLKGTIVPKRERLVELSRALNVNPVWLMGLPVSMRDELSRGNDSQHLADYIATQTAFNSISETDKALVEVISSMSEETKQNILSYARFMAQNKD